MIPLYQAAGLDATRPVKNPIYFFRKAMGREPTDMASVIVLNSEDSAATSPDVSSDYLPVGFDYRPTQPANTWYDLEVAAFQPMWDANVEPNADRDGSLGSEPHRVQGIVTLRGFIRASNYSNLYLGIDFLNYAFDPVINFLEGSSTFNHTLAPNSQPFNNVGFGVLAWKSGDVDSASGLHYEELNRFMFVRGMGSPVQIGTKFDDFNAPFVVQLLAIDPREYEFIAPASFNQTIDTVNGNNLTPEDGGPATVSTETIEYPDVIWDPYGPGYREETSATETQV